MKYSRCSFKRCIGASRKLPGLNDRKLININQYASTYDHSTPGLWRGPMCLLKLNRLYLLLLLIFLASCNAPEKGASFEGVAMTIPYKVLIPQKLNSEQKKSIQEEIHAIFHKIDAIYNNWNKDSEISRLNNLPANKRVPISQELFFFLQKVYELVYQTDSLFDPTISPLYSLWKRNLLAKELPSPEEIERVSLCCGWDKIHHEKGLFWKEHENASFDFCGCVKGYCVDLLTERLQALGFEDGLVEWGGEIRAFGNHSTSRPWRVGISPISFSHALQPISLENEAIATSGDTWSFWEVDNTTYSHIIHPHTKAPMRVSERSIASVTVVAKSCMQADAFATALMLFQTPEEATLFGSELKKRFPEIQFWIQTRS